MKNQNQIFDLFISPDENRADLRKPFRQGNYIFASDGHVIIRVAITAVDNPEQYGLAKVDAMPLFYHSDNCNFNYTKARMDKALKKVPVDMDCPECSGCGDVTYKYFSRQGDTFKHDFHCPVCGGEGTIDTSDYYITQIGTAFFKMHILEVLRDTARLMGLTSITKVHDSKTIINIFYFSPDVLVGAMPMFMDDKTKHDLGDAFIEF